MLRFLADAEERLGAFMLILLFLVVLLQIFARTVGWSIVWTEESSRFLFIWVIFLGISAGVSHDSHIGTNVFVDLLPKRLHKAASFTKTFLFLLFTGYMVKLSFSLLSMQLQFKQYAPATGIPGFIVSAALPIGFILTSLRLVAKLLRTVRPPTSGWKDSTGSRRTV